VPSGLSRDGLPTGLSIVGKTYDDVAAFRVAAAHEVMFPLAGRAQPTARVAARIGGIASAPLSRFTAANRAATLVGR
jgi:hypothetical protein